MRLPGSVGEAERALEGEASSSEFRELSKVQHWELWGVDPTFRCEVLSE